MRKKKQALFGSQAPVKFFYSNFTTLGKTLKSITTRSQRDLEFSKAEENSVLQSINQTVHTHLHKPIQQTDI